MGWQLWVRSHSMTSALEEVEAFARRADALVVNLGTLDEERRTAIRLAAAVARNADKPWIVDPVHCDYSPSRLAFARELIASEPSVVRGNASEMDRFRGRQWRAEDQDRGSR